MTLSSGLYDAMLDLIAHLIKRYNSAALKCKAKPWELPHKLLAVTDETSNGTWRSFEAEVSMVSGDTIKAKFSYQITRYDPARHWTEPDGPFWMCKLWTSGFWRKAISEGDKP